MKKIFGISLLLSASAAALSLGIFVAVAATKTTSATPQASATIKTAAPAVKAAAKPAPFKYAVWLPFWQSKNGAQDISLNLDTLNEVSPFSYEIKDGAIKDDLLINNGSWDPWFSSVRELGIKIIPTLAWFDTGGIYQTLSVASTRQAQEDAIAALVMQQKFDGIDIDYEAMSGATRPYYSLFIKGLAMRLHPSKKLLTCTVVPRTPPDSLYVTIPATIVYPEDYTVLNKYCDEVRLMAYDQGPIDLKLNASKGDGTFYAPVADPAWAKKVIQLALQSISPKKIMLGIPTYGYEWEVSWQPNSTTPATSTANAGNVMNTASAAAQPLGVTTYRRVRAFNYLDALDRNDDLSTTMTRNNAGEMSFMFASTTFIDSIPVLTTDVPSTTEPVALAALDGGNTDGTKAVTLFYVSFPDATSAADSIALAKSFGLRGAVFFKADGQFDPMTWQAMKP
jgi:spore germination protein YaaH